MLAKFGGGPSNITQIEYRVDAKLEQAFARKGSKGWGGEKRKHLFNSLWFGVVGSKTARILKSIVHAFHSAIIATLARRAHNFVARVHLVGEHRAACGGKQVNVLDFIHSSRNDEYQQRHCPAL